MGYTSLSHCISIFVGLLICQILTSLPVLTNNEMIEGCGCTHINVFIKRYDLSRVQHLLWCLTLYYKALIFSSLWEVEI